VSDTWRVDGTAQLIDVAPRTFFGVPGLRELDGLDAQVAFLGVPYDGGTPEPGIATGQRAGPAGAREASGDQFYYPWSAGAGGDPGAEGWYDVEADRDYLVGVTMVDVGDVAIQGSDTEGNYERITGAARRIAERGALMVAIGGDHSISYPLGRGMEPLGEFDVVHVDAHTDFMDELGGVRLTGASQLRRLAELPFVGTVAALGVRNVLREEVDALRELGGRWATSSTCSSAGPARWCLRPCRRRRRCTSRSTSMCSTPRSRPGTHFRSRAGSATASCGQSWSKWRDAGA
jgi:agmatinase